MSFDTIFWDVILGWYYNILGWKLSKQTSYWSKTGFCFSVKNHNIFLSQNNVPKYCTKGHEQVSSSHLMRIPLFQNSTSVRFGKKSQNIHLTQNYSTSSYFSLIAKFAVRLSKYSSDNKIPKKIFWVKICHMSPKWQFEFQFALPVKWQALTHLV